MKTKIGIHMSYDRVSDYVYYWGNIEAYPDVMSGWEDKKPFPPHTHTHRHSQANEEFLGPRSRCPKPKEEKSFRRSM